MHASDGLSFGLGRRLPVVLQTETAECGLACLAMVAAFHGYRIDLASLRRRFPVSLKGTTLAALIDVASRLGLATRAVRLELTDLGRLRCPCILHWELDHFVVLKQARGRRLRIHDPAAGERNVSIEHASAAFTGVALELWPSERFQARDAARAVRLRDLIGRVTGLAGSLAQIFALAGVLELVAVVSPLFLQWVVDHALVSANRDLLTLLALGFGLLVVLEQSVALLRAWAILHLGAALRVQWHANVFAHLLRLPLPYFEKRHLGDIVSRFRSIDAVQRTLTTAFVEAVVDGLMAGALAVVMVWYSPALAAICFGATALYGLGRWLAYRPLRHAAEEEIVHAAKQDTHLIESIRGVRAIKLFERQQQRRAAWLGLLVDQVNAGLRVQRLQVLHRLTHGLLFGIENVWIVWLGAHFVLDGRFSVGMLLALLAYKRLFAARVGALIDKLVELKMLRLQGERLADIVLTEAEPADAGRLTYDGSCAPTIETRGLRFRYADYDPYVLDGVDLVIGAGESVAIVGASGCGKTTLLHVLLGILPPSEGEVLIGGVSLAQIGAETARRAIGSVTQADTLFAGSIADNISFFDERADQQRIEECARLAAIHADIVALPMAYGTLVGHMGSALSAGQQQRILLARALYKRPAILVLDEATSHLDVERENAVNAAIQALRVTRVIVAHRPQTVAAADRVVVLEAGRIARDSGRCAVQHTIAELGLGGTFELGARELDLLASNGC